MFIYNVTFSQYDICLLAKKTFQEYATLRPVTIQPPKDVCQWAKPTLLFMFFLLVVVSL